MNAIQGYYERPLTILPSMCDATAKLGVPNAFALFMDLATEHAERLGIGMNGHIGFNEPDDSLNTKTHLTDLTESTITANSRFFESEDDVPKQAITMGISTILSAKKIILLASGKEKRQAISALLRDEINTEIPATMLKVHPDVVLICDREAYGEG